MANILKTDRQIQVLKLLTEGNSLSSTSRYTGIHIDTCTSLAFRFGNACQRFLDRELRDLELRHLQIDELWTFCRKKKKNVDGSEPDAQHIGEFYIFVALDEDSRLIPAHRVGRRDEENAVNFMFDLRDRLQRPNMHYVDSSDKEKQAYNTITRISTDAFPGYVKAVDLAFGPYADYGQIVKVTSKEGVETTKLIYQGNVKPEEVTTSLIERNNLTSRTFMKRLMRKTLGFSKKLENLRAATVLHMAYYNYCWKIKTLKTTPARAVGICGKEWTIYDLYEHVQDCAPELVWS